MRAQSAVLKNAKNCSIFRDVLSAHRPNFVPPKKEFSQKNFSDARRRFLISKNSHCQNYKTAAIAASAIGALLFCASCAELSQFDEPAREKDALRICPQCANPSYRFDEELFRLIAEAQHRGDPLSREDFRPILNAAAIPAKTNTSYAFMSPLGAGTRSELGARILPNGHFRLKLTIGRDSFVISGKCD